MLDQDKKLERERRARDIREDIVTMIGVGKAGHLGGSCSCLLYTSTTWSSLKIYFAITIILSLIGWTTLARVVRGKLLELRNEDFVTAARVSGATDGYIIVKHLLPSFSSYPVSYTHLDVYKRQGEDCATSMPGVFAAGDIRTKKLRQIVTAVADGANAVEGIQEYFL